jgi:type 1 glutamine amidotransferase
MRRPHQSFLLVAVLLSSTALAPAITPEERARIRAAAPGEATATPAEPRRVLVYNACAGYVHSAIPYGEAALRALGEKTGAFTIEATASPDVFRPERLAKFDAVVLNNTTGTLFADPVLRQSLLDFVAGGGGLVGIHAATDCFYDWPEFGRLIGGYFDGHPWNEEVTIRNEAPGHPLTASIGDALTVADEIYQFRAPYSRDNVRVLLASTPTAPT